MFVLWQTYALVAACKQMNSTDRQHMGETLRLSQSGLRFTWVE